MQESQSRTIPEEIVLRDEDKMSNAKRNKSIQAIKTKQCVQKHLQAKQLLLAVQACGAAVDGGSARPMFSVQITHC